MTLVNPWDPRQPRGADGRWTVEGAVAASRDANARSTDIITGAFTGNIAHRKASDAHALAAEGHGELATRHAGLGNQRAGVMHRSLADEHRDSAEYHAERIERSAPLARGRGQKPGSAARSSAAYRGHETRSEREQAATVNIPPDLLPLWDRTKGQFRGTPHERYEAFMEYAEAHPRDAADALSEESDRKLGELVKEHEDLRFANPSEGVTMASEYDLGLVRGVAIGLGRDVKIDLDGSDLIVAGEKYGTSEQAIGALRAIVTVTETVKINPAPSYKESHWGRLAGGQMSLHVGDPRTNGKLVGYGELIEVVYLTQKGRDKGPTEYQHKFRRELPILSYGNRDGRLYVAGGSYKCEARGIVG